MWGKVTVAKKQKKCISVQNKKRTSIFAQLRPSAKLAWVVKRNPKTPGSIAYTQFAKYRRASTVGEFQQLGGRAIDLLHDLAHGFVKVLGAKTDSSADSSSSSSGSTPLERVKVACLGDSNSQGFGLGNDSYPNRLKHYFKIRARPWKVSGVRFDVRNFAHCGAKAAPGNTQYCQQTCFEKGLAWKAQVYLIMLGTNDAHQAQGQPDKVESALEALVGKIIGKVPNAMVVLILPPGINSTRCRENMFKTVHPGIKRLGKKLQLTVVDPCLEDKSLKIKSKYYKADRLHLSKLGALKVARLASVAVLKLIKSAKKPVT